MAQEKKFLTTKEATEYCHCCRVILEQARKAGKLDVAKIGKGRTSKILYDTEELNKWLFSNARKEA